MLAIASLALLGRRTETASSERAATPVTAASNGVGTTAPTTAATDGSRGTAGDAPATTAPTPTIEAPTTAPATAPTAPVATAPPTVPGEVVGTPTNTPTAVPVTATISTPVVHAGASVTVHVAANPGSKLYGVEARLCRSGVDMLFTADFNPTQTGNCVLNPLMPDTDTYTLVKVDPPYASADLTFRVGAGTDNFHLQQGLGGDPVSVTCNAASPCQLVLRLQVPDATVFKTFPLTYG